MRRLCYFFAPVCAAFVLGPAPRHNIAARACRVRLADELSNEELAASLRARLEGSSDKSRAPPPLGPDEVGADSMNASDVIDYVLVSLKADACGAGVKALLSFAVRYEGDSRPEDSLGQHQPGFTTDPARLVEFWKSGHRRYEPLTRLSEYKRMGPGDDSDMGRIFTQKLLVRASGGGWQELFINCVLSPQPEGAPCVKRWLISSIYTAQEPCG